MKLGGCSAAGEKGLKIKLSLHKKQENTAVSGKHPILVVPSVRILNRVGVHVTAVAVPVHVHRAELSYRKPSLPPSLEYSQDCIEFGTSKSASLRHQFLYFLRTLIILLQKIYPLQLSRKAF